MKLIRMMSLSFVFAVVATPLLALKIGDTMPKVRDELVNIGGTKVALNNLKGDKGTLVFFTCNHCPFSKAWEARYTKFGNEMAKKGLAVIAVNSNDPEKQAEDGLTQMQAKAKRLGMKFPYAVDETSEVARAFGATRTPEFFLFDTAGKLVYTGAFDDNAEDAKAVKARYLADAAKAYLAKKPIQVAETKSVGCGIKFRERRTTAEAY